jgi:hypothetical protein
MKMFALRRARGLSPPERENPLVVDSGQSCPVASTTPRPAIEILA